LWEEVGVCTVVVVYEDAVTRDHAMQLCNRLTEEFKGDLQFQCTWWGTKYFCDRDIARHAAEAARDADLIIVSVHDQELPAGVKAWFESWPALRTASEGVLVAIGTPDETGVMPVQDQFMRLVAQQAKLDFLALPSRPVAARLPGGVGIVPDPSLWEQAGDYEFREWGIND